MFAYGGRRAARATAIAAARRTLRRRPAFTISAKAQPAERVQAVQAELSEPLLVDPSTALTPDGQACRGSGARGSRSHARRGGANPAVRAHFCGEQKQAVRRLGPRRAERAPWQTEARARRLRQS